MGRAIVVGDRFQSLYAFRGADSQAFDRIREMLEKSGRNLSVRHLPVNYRSDRNIIEYARQWVPALEGHKVPVGTVDEIYFAEAVERANNDGTDIELPDGVDGKNRTLPVEGAKERTTFAFLCRVNLPLVVTAYHLIGLGKKVCIIGREQIGEPLKQLCRDLCGTNPYEDGYTDRLTDKVDDKGRIEQDGLMTRLNNYLRVQTEKFKDEEFKNKLEAIQQNVECLQVIAEKVMDDSVQSVVEQIDTLFSDEPAPGVISLSTVHRAKGLEWDVVFVLRPDLLPHPNAKTPEEIQQEMNACYVAATRARNRLYYVVNWPFGKSPGPLNWELEFSSVPTVPARNGFNNKTNTRDEGHPWQYGPGDHLTGPERKAVSAGRDPRPPAPPVQRNPVVQEDADDGEPF
jgi:hypothetical protein